MSDEPLRRTEVVVTLTIVHDADVTDREMRTAIDEELSGSMISLERRGTAIIDAVAVSQLELPAVHLTPRELEILGLIARGLSNPVIARELHFSPNTVKQHLANLSEKLEVHGRAALVAEALRRGLISHER